MKNIICFILSFLFVLFLSAQNSFKIANGATSAIIPFEQVSNLIILSAQFNGKDTKFILDTGASKTFLFNWDNIDSLNFEVKSTLYLQGYGESEPLLAYYTENNRIKIGAFYNDAAQAFVLADKMIDMLPQLGVFVNGILGADFFSNYAVQIDYRNSRLTIVEDVSNLNLNFLGYFEKDIKVINGRPFVDAFVSHANSFSTISLLIDSGSSDSLWLNYLPEKFIKPAKYFDDYLGFGINGEIYGKRSKIDKLGLGDYKITNLAVSFPDKESLSTSIDTTSSGSIGGELLRRFDLVFDFPNSKIYLKSNESFYDKFYFNLAGIEVRGGKMQLFSKFTNDKLQNPDDPFSKLQGRVVVMSNSIKPFIYLPEIIINYVRKGSPADLAGIQVGDKIVYLSGLTDSNLTIEAVNDIFYQKVNKNVKIKIRRKDELLEYKFKQVPLID